MIFHTLILAALTNMVGLISPGPDFVYVSRNALLHNRRVGYLAALGITSGLFIHAIVCVFVLPYFVAEKHSFIQVIEYLGCAYLCYLSISSFFAFFSHGKNALDELAPLKKSHKPISPQRTVLEGFLCNALNPKAYLFYISIYSALIAKNVSFGLRGLFAIYFILSAWLWFSMVALLFTHKKLANSFLHHPSREKMIHLFSGLIFLAFSVGMVVFLS